MIAARVIAAKASPVSRMSKAPRRSLRRLAENTANDSSLLLPWVGSARRISLLQTTDDPNRWIPAASGVERPGSRTSRLHRMNVVGACETFEVYIKLATELTKGTHFGIANIHFRAI